MDHSVDIVEHFEIPTADGLRLGASEFKPRGKPLAVVQFHSGIGIRRHFYRHFATYLASHGFGVVTFDYRGIGDSRPKTLRGFSARMSEWGTRDMAAVLDWLERTHPTLPKYAVAHSMGGQLIGLMPNNELLRGVLTIATSSAYWQDFPFPALLYPSFMWFVYAPVATRLFGYVPVRRLGAGEDLPLGVAREWASWCRQQRYLSHALESTLRPNFYANIRLPMHGLALDDDWIAPPHKSQTFLRAYYPNAALTFSSLPRASSSRGSVGHFGYFRKEHGDAYWPPAVDWLRKQAQAATVVAHA